MAATNDEPTHRLQKANEQRYKSLTALLATIWGTDNTGDVEDEWEGKQGRILSAVTAYQQGAAYDGAITVFNQLKADGHTPTPLGVIDPATFSGMAPGGGALQKYLQAGIERVLILPVSEQHSAALKQLSTLSLEAVRAPVRWGLGAGITARPEVGYIREINPPSCKDCAVLNGRFYRWNEGFQRHPHCDCVHRPITLEDARFREITGQDEVPLDQITGLTKAERAALENGADLGQVVNASRGAKGDYTTEGTTARGAYTKFTEYGRAGVARLTPEAIMRIAPTREDAVQMLKDYGYMLSGIKEKTYTGYGQFGNKAWGRNAVLDALQTGVRNPNNPATMTAAEYRKWLDNK